MYEHFPAIGLRMPSSEYVEGSPRACQYSAGTLLHVPMHHRQLDEVTIGEVHWTSYNDHRWVKPLKDICLFSGYIRWCLMMH